MMPSSIMKSKIIGNVDYMLLIIYYKTKYLIKKILIKLQMIYMNHQQKILVSSILINRI